MIGWHGWHVLIYWTDGSDGLSHFHNFGELLVTDPHASTRAEFNLAAISAGIPHYLSNNVHGRIDGRTGGRF